MITSTKIEQKQLNLNQIEYTYRKGIKMLNFKSRLKKKFFNIFLQNQKIGIFNSLKCEKFIKEYFFKISFFFYPNNQIQSWVFFWIINSFDLIRKSINPVILKNFKKKIQNLLFRCGQKAKLFLNSSNLISLYTLTLSFFSLSVKFSNIKKFYILKIYSFLKKILRSKNFIRCSFIGESDPRSVFSILVISSLFNILTKNLFKKMIFEINQINSFDGGFSCDKSRESHGALSFCLLGSCIFFSTKNYSLKVFSNFKIWFLEKLKYFDSGIQGRPNKIVDSCYIFWLGASSIVLSINIPFELLNVLFFCFKLEFKGFCDQIGKAPDLYHTFYSISGLSLLSFVFHKKKKIYDTNTSCSKFFQKYGLQSKINPIYGIRERKIFLLFQLQKETKKI